MSDEREKMRRELELAGWAHDGYGWTNKALPGTWTTVDAACIQELLAARDAELAQARAELKKRHDGDPSIPMTPYDYGYEQGHADASFQARASIKGLRDIVSEFEWSACSQDSEMSKMHHGLCPACYRDEIDGHAAKCSIGAALAASREPEPAAQGKTSEDCGGTWISTLRSLFANLSVVSISDGSGQHDALFSSLYDLIRSERAAAKREGREEAIAELRTAQSLSGMSETWADWLDARKPTP